MLFVLCPAESSSLFGNISWVKAWKLPNKFFINNKIKEVSYKILHRIYAAAKHVLERFKLNISYTFCGQEKETISLYLLKIILEGFGIIY